MSQINLPFDEVSQIIADQFNQGESSAGNEVSPAQRGEYRVPVPSGFRAVDQGAFSWGSNFVVLSWNDIEDHNVPVKAYNIYVTNSINSQQEPDLVGSSSVSPAHVTVPANSLGTVVFWLQPVLASGQSLPLSACPTCTIELTGFGYSLTLTDPTYGYDVTVRIDDDIVSGGGGTTAGLGVSAATNGAFSYVSWSSHAIINGNDKLGVAMALTGGPPAAGAAGIVRVADGTGTGGIVQGTTVQLEGANGKVRCYHKAITPTYVGYLGEWDGIAPGASGGPAYLVIELDGTRYKILCQTEV